MNCCFSGKDPYQPKAPLAAVHIVPRPGDVLCIGRRCADGRPIRESWKYQEAVRLGCKILRAKPIAPSRLTHGAVDYEEVHGVEEEETESVADAQPFVVKYRPVALNQIIGHRAELVELREWLAGWSTAAGTPRAALIHGPPGIGKTTVAHLLATEAGYQVTEYNASDARSVSKLQGLFSLGMKRLGHELIVMDEVDGLSERGGVGEVVSIVKRTLHPMICIANEVGPTLTPLKNACLTVSFHRPMKGTIAQALLPVCAAENIPITKAELEKMCEKNGNDIRAVLNQLEFNEKGGSGGAGDKDESHGLTPFRAAGTLLSVGNGLTWERAADLLYYDPFLVPLMVQEGYLSVHTAAGASLDETAAAADWISRGDLIHQRLLRTQDWSLLPAEVATTVAAARIAKGRVPQQLFPQLLGKMSKRAKHVRWLDDMGRRLGDPSSARFRLDALDPLRTVVHQRLATSTGAVDLKHIIAQLQDIGLTRDDVVEVMDEIRLTGASRVEIPTKTKSAFTREWNKATGVGSKRKATVVLEEDVDEDMDELEEAMESLDLEE